MYVRILIHKYRVQEYVSSLKKTFNWNELSYFELNLETWRQLWRVLEMSDVVLYVVDIRFPVCFLLFSVFIECSLLNIRIVYVSV